MSNQSVTRDISAEPTRVWSVLTDLEHTPETLSAVDRVEVLTEGPYRLGTRWRETRSVMGREETNELEVTRLEALGFIQVESTSGEARSVATFTLEALHPGTRLTMTSDAAPAEDAGTLKKLAAKIVAPVGQKAARSAMETDIEDVARAAESSRH